MMLIISGCFSPVARNFPHRRDGEKRRWATHAATGNSRAFPPYTAQTHMDNETMSATVEFARMNGLGNKILVVDMRGRTDKVTPQAAIALNADAETRFDQIMAIHDPKAEGTDAWIDILNCDGTKAQACGNGTRCVVQALSAATGKKVFTFQTVAGILNASEHEDGM